MKDNSKDKLNIVVLLGFPRSGTTWFSNLLNSHSKVYYRHELIGRGYHLFGNSLFHELKNNDGLSDKDYNAAMNIIRSAYVESDKPPFFYKKFGLHRFPRIHYFAWAIARLIPVFKPLYDFAFKLKAKNDWTVLLKETRSLTNMGSIVKGLRSEKLIFLIRMPHGSILSHLKGVEKGNMERISTNDKENLLSEAKTSSILGEKFSNKHCSQLSDVEYYAASWTLYHEKVLQLRGEFPNSIICSYDQFVDNTLTLTTKLMDDLNLEGDQDVLDFISESSGEKKIKLKDAGSDYFSVYREKSFNKDSWEDDLSSADIQIINELSLPLYNKLTKEKQ